MSSLTGKPVQLRPVVPDGLHGKGLAGPWQVANCSAVRVDPCSPRRLP